MKLDAYVQVSKTHGRVIDYKSGKVFGNEVKHTEQGQLYQLATFLKFPDLETLDVEFWYIDHGPEYDMITSYTREQGTLYFDKYHNRGAAMTDCTDFKPNPNVYSCRWCPYNQNACKFGISKQKNIAPVTSISKSGLAASFTAKTASAKV
jgi:PD-(D/E)XK nuclease superfamily